MKNIHKAKIGDRVAFKPLAGDAGEYAEGTIQSFADRKRSAYIHWDDGEDSYVTDADYDRIHLIEEPPFDPPYTRRRR